jgi:hypothetical protein
VTLTDSEKETLRRLALRDGFNPSNKELDLLEQLVDQSFCELGLGDEPKGELLKSLKFKFLEDRMRRIQAGTYPLFGGPK